MEIESGKTNLSWKNWVANLQNQLEHRPIYNS